MNFLSWFNESRDAYPADVFNVHGGLLERGGKIKWDLSIDSKVEVLKGNGSIRFITFT